MSSIGTNNFYESKITNHSSIHHDQKLISAIKHFLDYLPSTLIKLIFEKNILNEDKAIFPFEYKFRSCFIFINISEIKEYYINHKINTSKESFECIFSYINKNIEGLASIMNDFGCDVIFSGNGLYAFYPPEFDDEVPNEADNSKIFNKLLKMMQCALEIKKVFYEAKKCFKIKIGISYGECKLIIIDNKVKNEFFNNNEYKNSYKSLEFTTSSTSNVYINSENLIPIIDIKNNNFYYFVYGKPLIDSCENANKADEGQIIIDQKLHYFLSESFELEEINDKYQFSPVRLFKVIKPIQSLKFPNRTLINNRINISDKTLISKKDIIFNFSPNFIFKTITGKGYVNGRWIKETRYLTILMLRPIIRSQDLNKTEKIYQLIKTINGLINELGGLIFEIMVDEKGIKIMIVFGLQKFMSVYTDELISVIFAFEITKKLKDINIYAHIGISSDLAHLNFIKCSGGRKNFSIIGDVYIQALQCLTESEKMFGGKILGPESIILDKNTMDMIDSFIPCGLFKKVKNKILSKDIYLFTPLKINKLSNIHKDENLLPLLGSHLHFVDKNIDLSNEDNNIINDKKYINFFDQKQIIYFCDLLKKFIENKAQIKLININSLNGSGKTLFISESLKTFFRQNTILKEIICYKYLKNDYPFIFISKLPVVMYSSSYNDYSKKEFKAVQHILAEIFNYLYNDINQKLKLLNLIEKNNCLEYLNFFEYFFGNKELKLNFEYDNYQDQSNFIFSNEEDRFKLYSFFIDMINEYANYINKIDKEKIKQYNIKIPIFFIIESINISDKYSLEFIVYYLNQSSESNEFLFITTNSIPLFPQYIYLKQNIINPFNKVINNPYLYMFEISTLNCRDKLSSFIISLLEEKRGLLIQKVSDNILNFLTYKTFGGVQDQVIKLILYLYDNNHILVKKIDQDFSLIENEEFELMIKLNDFIDLTIPYSIEKNIYNIINKELAVEEIALLKICSVLGDLFDTAKLSQVLTNNGYSFINSFNDYWKKINDSSSKQFNLYEKIIELEKKNIIEILFDNQINHKFVVCKFSIPFMREILYQCTSIEQRNELHYIIGKIIKNTIELKGDCVIYKYYSDEIELLNLKKHLRKMEIFMHDYNTRKFNKFDENISIKNEENFTINNLKTIIIQEISNKLSHSNNNDNTVIKCGYADKKSDGKITWEKRFFILTPNRLSYYYVEEDYLSNKEPLGFFYLRNLYDVKVLRNNYNNTFCLTVNEWMKKKELMKERNYILITKKWEELYSWTISLKILKLKAFYDNFCSNFCFVKFPLFEIQKKNTFLKDYVFTINKKNDAGCCHFGSISSEDNSGLILRNDTFARNERLNQRVSVRKLSIISNYFCLNIKETYSLKKRTYHLFQEILYNHFKIIFRFCFSTFFNNIQIKINTFKDILNNNFKMYDFFESPFIMENYGFDLKNLINKISNNNQSLRKTIDLEKKSAFFDSKKTIKYLSPKNIEYLKNYFPIKSYGDSINFKVVELKKIIKKNKIIAEKNYDDIQFIEEPEEKIKIEDNLRFGDYIDITSPYPLNKFSTNNNFFLSNNDNETVKRKKSILLQYKESGHLSGSDLDIKKVQTNVSQSNNNNNNIPSPLTLSLQISNLKTNLEEDKTDKEETKDILRKRKITIFKSANNLIENVNKLLKKENNKNNSLSNTNKNNSNNKNENETREILRKSTVKTYNSILSKELESIKEEEVNLVKSKNNDSFSSSSLTIGSQKSEKQSKNTLNKYSKEKTILKMEFINNIKDDNGKNIVKKSVQIGNINKEEFNFGELLRNYTNSMKFKKNIMKKSIKKKEVTFMKKDSAIFDTKFQKKERSSNLLKNSNKNSQKEISEKENADHFFQSNRNTFKPSSSNNSLSSSFSNKINKSSIKNIKGSNSKSSTIFNNNSNNSDDSENTNENLNIISSKSERSSSNKYEIKSSSKNNKISIKNLISQKSNKSKEQVKDKDEDKDEDESDNRDKDDDEDKEEDEDESKDKEKNGDKDEEKNKNKINSDLDKIENNLKESKIIEEEESSKGNIISNTNKSSQNDNNSLNNGNNTERNNFSFSKRLRSNYNSHIISLFSKPDNSKAKKYMSSTDLTNSTTEKNDSDFIKTNQNLKLWLMNQTKETKKAKDILENSNANSLNFTKREQSSSYDMIDSLDESYSYIKKFMVNNYHDTQKHCELRKKFLGGLNSKSVIYDKKNKENNNSQSMIQKLKNKSISLEKEKEYFGCFKDILLQNKLKKINGYYGLNDNNTHRSKNSNNYDNSTSNNTYRNKNFYYPDVFYVNENEQLHKKIHVSNFFSKLKSNNKFK